MKYDVGDGDGPTSSTARGFWPIEDYVALGDGRSIALVTPSGSADWWCVPNIDSPATLDRLIDQRGGYFSVRPDCAFEIDRRYRPNSNVVESIIRTKSGSARVVESLNSSMAGRLPWTEFARRVEGLTGEVHFRVRLHLSTHFGSASPWLQQSPNGCIFHVGTTLGLLRFSDNVSLTREADQSLEAIFTVTVGERAIVAVLAGADEPLGVPPIEEIDRRIDLSDTAWAEWAENIRYEGLHKDLVIRSALTLKLLLFSPSGAIAAAGTTSLPEKLGGSKNWDYRYAWIRDAAYTVNAFLRLGIVPEAKAAFTWLMHRIGEHGARVVYTLDGKIVARQLELDDVRGYENSQPVVIGNQATSQHQHGVYGDIFETAALFVRLGNILDQKSARLLAGLADECADHWRQKDAGIWELTEPQHYTMSKISCWQALARACELAEDGHIPRDCLSRWKREHQRIASWVDEHCWSTDKSAYTFYPDTDRLDASIALAVRFGFPNQKRLEQTLQAIQSELGTGSFTYRYTGADQEEGAFLACSFWIVEALAELGRYNEAEKRFSEVISGIAPSSGILSEMIDPKTGAHLGNTPQGLSHLALIHAACSVSMVK